VLVCSGQLTWMNRHLSRKLRQIADRGKDNELKRNWRLMWLNLSGYLDLNLSCLVFHWVDHKSTDNVCLAGPSPCLNRMNKSGIFTRGFFNETAFSWMLFLWFTRRKFRRDFRIKLDKMWQQIWHLVIFKINS
jgi:hypothetical protein